MDYKTLAIEKFSKDIYSTKTTGITIEEADINYAKCSLIINESHMNAAGFVMGGAIFTLADFAFAIATNIVDMTTVSITSQINYINATKGPVLFAETKCIKSGKSVCFYEIIVTDDKQNIIATVSITGFKR